MTTGLAEAVVATSIMSEDEMSRLAGIMVASPDVQRYISTGLVTLEKAVQLCRDIVLISKKIEGEFTGRKYYSAAEEHNRAVERVMAVTMGLDLQAQFYFRDLLELASENRIPLVNGFSGQSYEGKESFREI